MKVEAIVEVTEDDIKLAEYIASRTRGYGVHLPSRADTRVQAVARFRLAGGKFE